MIYIDSTASQPIFNIFTYQPIPPYALQRIFICVTNSFRSCISYKIQRKVQICSAYWVTEMPVHHHYEEHLKEFLIDSLTSRCHGHPLNSIISSILPSTPTSSLLLPFPTRCPQNTVSLYQLIITLKNCNTFLLNLLGVGSLEYCCRNAAYNNKVSTKTSLCYTSH